MQKAIQIRTSKKEELIDITEKIKKIVKESKIQEGICNIYARHATAAVIINENADPNIQDDILKALNKMIPAHDNYKHDIIDNNAAAHIKATLLGPSETIPIKNNELQLGTWQSVMLVELDGPRPNREIVITIASSN